MVNRKDMLRVYSLSQLLNQEVIRLEERNLSKRTLSVELAELIDKKVKPQMRRNSSSPHTSD